MNHEDPSPLDRATAELTRHMGNFAHVDGTDIPHIRTAARDTIYGATAQEPIAEIITRGVDEGRTDRAIANDIIDYLTGDTE